MKNIAKIWTGVDVGLPFGCPTVNYEVHVKAQGLVCPKESLCQL